MSMISLNEHLTFLTWSKSHFNGDIKWNDDTMVTQNGDEKVTRNGDIDS